MAVAVAGGLSRVTLVTPRSRVDMALPSDVPLAHLLPTLLSIAGPNLADEAAASGGWVLTRLDGQVLDGTRSAAQLAVRDGELLYLTPRASAGPELVFDDIVDAVATGTRARPGLWLVADSRRFAFALGALALLGGAMVMLLSGPPQLPGALVGLGGAAVLLLLASIASRLVADRRAGVVLGLVALGYSGIGGLLLLGGDRPLSELAAPDVLVAATALLLSAVVATVAIAGAGPIFLGAAVCAAGLALAAALARVFGVDPAAGAAVVVTLAYGALPMLPMAAYRMARLPIPSLPAGPDDVRADREKVDGRRVLAGTNRAQDFLAGALTTVAVVAGAGSVVLAVGGQLPGLLLSCVLGLLMLLRARPFLGRVHRTPMLASGVVSLVAATVALFHAAGPLVRLTGVLGGVLLIAAISIGWGIAGAGRRVSPIASRALDIGETLLIVSVVPLAAWVCGLYSWIRAIRG